MIFLKVSNPANLENPNLVIISRIIIFSTRLKFLRFLGPRDIFGFPSTGYFVGLEIPSKSQLYETESLRENFAEQHSSSL